MKKTKTNFDMIKAEVYYWPYEVSIRSDESKSFLLNFQNFQTLRFSLIKAILTHEPSIGRAIRLNSIDCISPAFPIRMDVDVDAALTSVKRKMKNMEGYSLGIPKIGVHWEWTDDQGTWNGKAFVRIQPKTTESNQPSVKSPVSPTASISVHQPTVPPTTASVKSASAFKSSPRLSSPNSVTPIVVKAPLVRAGSIQAPQSARILSGPSVIRYSGADQIISHSSVSKPITSQAGMASIRYSGTLPILSRVGVHPGLSSQAMIHLPSGVPSQTQAFLVTPNIPQKHTAQHSAEQSTKENLFLPVHQSPPTLDATRLTLIPVKTSSHASPIVLTSATVVSSSQCTIGSLSNVTRLTYTTPITYNLPSVVPTSASSTSTCLIAPNPVSVRPVPLKRKETEISTQSEVRQTCLTIVQNKGLDEEVKPSLQTDDDERLYRGAKKMKLTRSQEKMENLKKQVSNLDRILQESPVSTEEIAEKFLTEMTEMMATAVGVFINGFRYKDLLVCTNKHPKVEDLPLRLVLKSWGSGVDLRELFPLTCRNSCAASQKRDKTKKHAYEFTGCSHLDEVEFNRQLQHLIDINQTYDNEKTIDTHTTSVVNNHTTFDAKCGKLVSIHTNHHDKNMQNVSTSSTRKDCEDTIALPLHSQSKLESTRDINDLLRDGGRTNLVNSEKGSTLYMRGSVSDIQMTYTDSDESLESDIIISRLRRRRRRRRATQILNQLDLI